MDIVYSKHFQVNLTYSSLFFIAIMSDYEEDAAHYEEDGSIAAGDEDEGERQGGATNKGKDRRRKNDEEDEGEEEEEDEDEEEEDEDEEDEEDEEDPGQVRGKKRRKVGV